jgi:uncharacterized membrane protein YidH (DUF202 family)
MKRFLNNLASIISMPKNHEELKLLLTEEQTLLSRERTMHSYMQTGLAFTSVGLLIMKFMEGMIYFLSGTLLVLLGWALIIESGKRYFRFRKAVAALREREAKHGCKIGLIR